MNLRNKLATVGLTGAVFAGGVFGLSGLASAQTPTVDEGSTEAELIAPDSDDEVSEFDRFSPEDKELIVEFEQCLTDAGLDDLVEAEHDDLVEAEDDLDAIDEIFETCEVILDDLSFDADDWLEPELSPEHEAAFEEYEKCIENIDGFSLDDEADWTDEDYERFEAAAVECDSLLEGIDFEAFDFDLSEEDEAVFEEFDECIADTLGIDIEDQAAAMELTDEDFESLEGALEDCESILDDLSEDAQVLFDCEEGEYDEDHEDGVEGDLDGENVETLLSA